MLLLRWKLQIKQGLQANSSKQTAIIEICWWFPPESSPSNVAGVEPISDNLAQQIEADNEHKQCQAGEGGRPPLVKQVIASHRPPCVPIPAWAARCPIPENSASGGKGNKADIDRDVHYDGVEAISDDMPHDYPKMACSKGPGRQHIFFIS